MNTEFKRGDKIAINKGVLITHFGVYVDPNRVIDNSATCGEVRRRTLVEFQGGRKAYKVPHNSVYSPNEIVARAEAQLGKVYKLLTQNCEHFVNDIFHGKPFSKQVTTGIVLTGLVIFLKVIKK
ncbi:hypothetical protein A9Q96_15375 [Rhodobacterales bacterium 52_120_T64]|nr:hypothetical protein A9Q96_15375 [Rhodobacterales bacterium 52_120_T64]